MLAYVRQCSQMTTFTCGYIVYTQCKIPVFQTTQTRLRSTVTEYASLYNSSHSDTAFSCRTAKRGFMRRCCPSVCSFVCRHCGVMAATKSAPYVFPWKKSAPREIYGCSLASINAPHSFWPAKVVVINPSIAYSDWYTGRWWVGCYIWYSEEGTGRGRIPPRPLRAATAHPSTASVPTSYYSM